MKNLYQYSAFDQSSAIFKWGARGSFSRRSAPQQSFVRSSSNTTSQMAGLSAEVSKEQHEALEKIRERKQILMEVMQAKREKASNKGAWASYIDQFDRDTAAFNRDHPAKLTAAKQKALERLLRGYESHFAADLKNRKDLEKPKGRKSIKSPEEIFVKGGVHRLPNIPDHHTVGIKFAGEDGWKWFHPDEASEGTLEKEGYAVTRTEKDYDDQAGIQITLNESKQGSNFVYVIEEWDKYADYKEKEASPTDPDENTQFIGTDPFI